MQWLDSPIPSLFVISNIGVGQWASLIRQGVVYWMRVGIGSRRLGSGG